MKPKLLISACLLGERCRYDGQSKPVDLSALGDKFELIPICPEVMGGLRTPRTPCERKGSRVIAADGTDCTEPYRLGAEKVLSLARDRGCRMALLKEKSPSCGSGLIYDGTFTRTLKYGFGVTAELLISNGITVYGESQIKELSADTKVQR